VLPYAIVILLRGDLVGSPRNLSGFGTTYPQIGWIWGWVACSAAP